MANIILTTLVVYIIIGLLFSRLYLYKAQTAKRAEFLILVITLFWLPISILAMISVYKERKAESDE